MDYRILMSAYKGDEPGAFRRAIASIPDLSKLILVADGPLRPEVEAFLSDAGIVFHAHPVNRGLAYSLNRCLAIGMAEPGVGYFIRMDADDTTHPERFVRMTAFMDTHPGVDICGSFYHEMDEQERVFRSKRFPVDHADMVRILPFGSPICHASACFRRSFFEKAGIYSIEPRHNLVEDIELWFRAVAKGAVFANIPEFLYNVRVSSGFYRRRSLRKSLNELRVYVRGILALGFPIWRLAFPVARFLLRLAPAPIQRFAYRKYREPPRSGEASPRPGLESVGR